MLIITVSFFEDLSREIYESRDIFSGKSEVEWWWSFIVWSAQHVALRKLPKPLVILAAPGIVNSSDCPIPAGQLLVPLQLCAKEYCPQ